ncbi:MAG TPA: SDR family oxidoreductase [Vicinamibacteria bacterium]|nr:SDR family oxidoreductase [Vicinamibacteria bacterium]
MEKKTALDVESALDVLEAVVADRGLLAELDPETRRRLLVAAGRASRPETHQERRLARAFRRRKRERIEAADRASRKHAGIRAAREAAVFVAPARTLPEAPGGPERVLERPKSCYVCKAEFRRLHHFYDALCPECAAFNYEKRFQTAPLHGRVALITGARVKIGYQAALKMLRAGARVIATTRFPHDAAARYAREADFGAWQDRLHVYGLDLRHSPSVELFARHVERGFERLDVLINNACQTVRRPPGFYAHLVDHEERPLRDLGPELRPLLQRHHDFAAALESRGALPHAASAPDPTGLMAFHGGGSGLGLRASARLSQVRYAYEDAERRPDLFPEGARDADLQQIDLRRRNSWRLTLAEVETPELLEVQLVNAVAPFILCARLRALMTRDGGFDRHVVNVSAMEGVFSRGTKTDRHPHTNMAKAALNMMTLTSARDYVQDGIHMNAVDTGWVTDEDPLVHASRKKEELDFQPPLDIVDGAARICDPFFSGLLTGVHVWGRFLKDYKPSSW